MVGSGPGAGAPHPTPTVTRARQLMGTVFRFEAPEGSDPRITGEALEAGLDEVDRLEGILSNWREDSELSRLNREARLGPVTVSGDLFKAIRLSLRWARETGGAFDPTVEPLTRRFRSGSGGGKMLSSTEPKSFAEHGDWRDVVADASRRTILFRGKVEGLDLGGIGKGYALDCAAVFLRLRGLRSFLLDAGGQILAMGNPRGEKGWLTAVADPEHRERPLLPLLLRNVSAATSGNSERPGEILDPASGLPVLTPGSSTAVAAEASAADALSTALFVLGPERGTPWAQGRRDVAGIYLIPGPGKDGPPRAMATFPVNWEERRTILIETDDGERGALHVSTP
jgi:FAD:protein FMN transferase